MDFKDLVSEYGVLQSKYKLPVFKEINESFEIEKIDRESQTLLRFVRKVMMEKVVNLLGLIDLFLAPNNVPRMYLPYLKSMSNEDRSKLSDLYDRLSRLALECMPFELEYNEKGEAEMIIKIMKTWQDSRTEVRAFFAQMQRVEVKEKKKERSYFG